jgi:hypothetical protein
MHICAIRTLNGAELRNAVDTTMFPGIRQLSWILQLKANNYHMDVLFAALIGRLEKI